MKISKICRNFSLPKLPYGMNELMPHISKETLQYHHGKHHAAYVNKLNQLIEGKDYLKNLSLEEILRSQDGVLFNQAAQHWNHSFYWNCLKPNGGGQPTG